LTLAAGPRYHRTTLRPIRTLRTAQMAALVAVALAAVGYTPPQQLRADINPQPAQFCNTCHLDITQQWQASGHAKAHRSNNPLFGRMYFNSLKQTRGKTLLACGPCHEAMAYVTNDFENLRDVSREGVTCSFCHAIAGPIPEGLPAVALDLDAYHGTIRTPTPTSAHRSSYTPYLKTSEFCGACHKYSNQYGVQITDTIGEWKRTKYPKLGITCQGCHMPGGAGRNSYLGPVRPRVPDHSFDTAGNKALQGAATMALVPGRRTADSLHVFAVVRNVGAGHSLPTGNDQHMLLIRVRVLTDSGSIVWENDPFQEWTVSIFSLILQDEFGGWPAETWTARKILADRRIPAGGSVRVRYDVPLGKASGPLRVEAQLLYRRARPQTLASYEIGEDPYGAERRLAEASLRVP
jgi:cytochrome c554/c'-like protein